MSNHPHHKVGCDAHKHYSLFSALDARGNLVQPTRVDHEPGAIRAFLSQFPPGGQNVTGFAQAGPGQHLTWVQRDPRVDWAAPAEHAHAR
jgi:hypothetical protein